MTADAFVWNGKPLTSYGALLDAATAAAENGQATEFLSAYRVASEHADQNLGYLIGYCGEEDRKRMYAAFGLTHPVFGGTP